MSVHNNGEKQRTAGREPGRSTISEPTAVRVLRWALWAGLVITGTWFDGRGEASLIFAVYNAFALLLVILHFARHH